ncbi:hypothetical protein FKM82_004825 [Ascaphus truei]
MPRLWFGFGYRGFGQIGLGEDLSLDLPEPVQLQRTDPGRTQISKVIPSWSYTAFLTEDGSLVLSGFVGGCPQQCLCLHGLGCLDLLPTEKYLMLLFNDRVECWDTMALGPEGMQREPTWKMDLPIGHNAGGNAGDALPTEGQVAEANEFITIQAFPALIDLPDELEAAKISCGSRHTAVVTRAGDLYTWGWGKYGQLGHGDTRSLDQPKLVEYFPQKQLCVNDVICRHWNTYVLCL